MMSSNWRLPGTATRILYDTSPAVPARPLHAGRSVGASCAGKRRQRNPDLGWRRAFSRWRTRQHRSLQRRLALWMGSHWTSSSRLSARTLRICRGCCPGLSWCFSLPIRPMVPVSTRSVSSGTFSATDPSRLILNSTGGALFTNHDVPTGTNTVNFMDQAALGMHILGSRKNVSVELRYMHISNAGLATPNPGDEHRAGTVGNWQVLRQQKAIGFPDSPQFFCCQPCASTRRTVMLFRYVYARRMCPEFLRRPR